jgi:hypothetical protein
MKKKVTLSPERVKFLQAIAYGNTVHSAAAQAELLKYSEDEPRDERGRFTSDGSDGANGNKYYGFGKAPQSGEDAKSYNSRIDELKETYGVVDKPDGTSKVRGIDWDVGNAETNAGAIRDAKENAREAAEKYDLKTTGGSIGPGAGTPMVNFSGPSHALYSMLDAYDNGEDVTEKIFKYSPDQPRDDHGRFTEGGGQGGDEEDSNELSPRENATAVASALDTMKLAASMATLSLTTKAALALAQAHADAAHDLIDAHDAEGAAAHNSAGAYAAIAAQSLNGVGAPSVEQVSSDVTAMLRASDNAQNIRPM